MIFNILRYLLTRALNFPFMKTENVLLVKSYVFALRMVKLQQFLVAQKKEHVLSKQVVRSGTSIGANLEEAN